MRPGNVAVLLPVLALVAAACSDDGGATATTTTAAAVDAAVVSTPIDDGILRLGVLAPLTGDGAPLGLSIQATVEMAVAAINDAGGANGRPVQLRIADEGSDIATATAGLDELLRGEVDAIVGPTSSTVTLSVLDTILRSQTLACSPTSTAMALDDFPDDGLFFRTAPSDTLEAEAIARAVDGTGRSSVGLLYVDDAYGRPFADSVRRALANRSIAVTADIPFSSADSGIDTEATVTDAIDAQVIAVIGDADSGARVASAVAAATAGMDTPIIVNDAMRGGTAAATFAQLPAEALERIIGVAPRALTDNAEFVEALAAVDPNATGLFAANAFDCVNLIALAADAVRSSDPLEIAARIPSVATSGTRCLDFASCAAGLTAERNVDYDGPSGLLQLAFDGDPNRGVYDLYRYGADGTEIPDGQVTVNI
jgi:branched-chain amino acid transport system substrate-binding protein